MTNLKIKIEGQASFADKAQVDKEIQELSRWLALSPSLRVPKKKNGKEGSDTSSSSSSSSSSDDEKSKKMPPDCKICHKEFGKVFKKPVTIYTLLSSPLLVLTCIFFVFFAYRNFYFSCFASTASPTSASRAVTSCTRSSSWDGTNLTWCV